MLRVYSEYYYRSYKAPYVSFGSFCWFAGLIIVVFGPFIILVTSPQFWVYTSVAYEQPRVEFNDEIYIQALGIIPNSEFLSTYSNTLEDSDNDGLNDILTTTIIIIPETGNTMNQVNIAIGLNYRLEQTADIILNTALFFSLGVSNSKTIKLSGDLKLNQRTPIYPSKKRRTLYEYEGIFKTLEDGYIDAFEVCYGRNYSLQYNYIQVSEPVETTPTELTIEIKMFIPPSQEILYQQPLFEIIKFSWIQYVAFFVTLYILIYYFVMWFSFRSQTLEGLGIHEGTLHGHEKLKQY